MVRNPGEVDRGPGKDYGLYPKSNEKLLMSFKY